MTVTLKVRGGYYYAVVYYKDGNSYKQKWQSLGLPEKNNKRRAEKMVEELREQYASSYSTPSGDMLFSDYVAKWLQNKQGLIRTSTWEGYKVVAERHIIPYFAKLKTSIRDVTPAMIRQYYVDKLSGGRMDGKPGGHTVVSLKNHGVVLKGALSDAVLDGYIRDNPAREVRIPSRDDPKKERVFLTAAEANELLKAFDGHELQPIVYVTLYYGLRRSEALGLRWSAIDFERNKLTINHTIVKNLTIVASDTTKTNSSYRTFDLIDDVKQVLLKQRESQIKNRKRFGKSYIDSDYIFTREDGSLYRPDSVTRGFERVLKSHGLPPMRFHDLRHSTASILYDKGWDLKETQMWLRHSSLDVTADIYTHISAERQAGMAERLNSTFTLSNKSTSKS